MSTQPKARPILMSGPMVRAILEERKSLTRRMGGLEDVNAQPSIWQTDGFGELSYMAKASAKGKPGATFRTSQLAPCTINVCPQRCPYGKPGDLLWVRERWQSHVRYDLIPPLNIPDDADICYAASHGCSESISWWRSPMHMPRWASRLTLEITDVRVQRLQDISSGDAIAEGLHRFPVRSGDAIAEYLHRFPVHCLPDVYAASPDDDARFFFPIRAFQALWESLHGKGSWEANPWVWAISFRRVSQAGAA